MVAGILFGALAVALMLPMTFRDQGVALLAAVSSRFAVGLMAATVTITVDNGPDFHGYKKKIEAATGVKIYFAKFVGTRDEREHERAHSAVHPKANINEDADAETQ